MERANVPFKPPVPKNPATSVVGGSNLTTYSRRAGGFSIYLLSSNTFLLTQIYLIILIYNYLKTSITPNA